MPLTVPKTAEIPGAEERSVVLDGVRWRYVQAGSGPPLLLLHGFMGYSFSWRFNVAPLAQHFTVIAPDLPGCGFSERTAVESCTLRSDADAVWRFLDLLGVEQVDIVSSSRGGALAMAMGALAANGSTQGRLRRQILTSPINPWSKHGKVLTRMLATGLGGMAVLHVLPRLHFLLVNYLRDLYGDPKRIAPGTVEGYEAGLQAPGSFEHLLRIVRSWHGDLNSLAQVLPLIQDIPTLLLWGAQDHAVYASSAYELHKRLKNSALIMMEGVGHLPYEEVPEEFNRIVVDFLLHHTPPTPLEQAAQEAVGSLARESE